VLYQLSYLAAPRDASDWTSFLAGTDGISPARILRGLTVAACLLGSRGADLSIPVNRGESEAAAAHVCKSTDRGASFSGIGPDLGSEWTTNGDQAGPSDDRQWLTAAPDGPFI